jgi:hypothetical protein
MQMTRKSKVEFSCLIHFALGITLIYSRVGGLLTIFGKQPAGLSTPIYLSLFQVEEDKWNKYFSIRAGNALWV